MYVILGTLRAGDSLGALWSWFTGPWVQSPDYYRPVISLLHWIDFQIWGSLGWGWRLTNALIIAATLPALTWLCAAGLRRPWAGPVAAFALPQLRAAEDMPLWPAWRTDAVCGFFLVLATGGALVYLREGRRRSLALTLVTLVLALMSKETAFIWPAFVAVLVLVAARNRRGLALLGSVFALTGAFWLMRVSLLGHPILGLLPQHVDFPVSMQLRDLLWTVTDPVYMNVTTTYPAVLSEAWWIIPTFWWALISDLTFIGANVLVGITSLRLLGLLWAWRVITYLPSMPFVRLYDFYYYIPAIGTAVLYGVAASVALRMLAPRARTWWESRTENDDGPEET